MKVKFPVSSLPISVYLLSTIFFKTNKLALYLGLSVSHKKRSLTFVECDPEGYDFGITIKKHIGNIH